MQKQNIPTVTSFTGEEIRAVIVSEGTSQGYGYQIMKLLEAGCKNEQEYLEGWFTDHIKESFKKMEVQVAETRG